MTFDFSSAARSRRGVLALGLSSLALGVAACTPAAGLGDRPQNATPRQTLGQESANPESAEPSGSGSPTSESTTPEIPVSKDLDDITVTGEMGDEPTVEVPKPWGVDKTRVRVLDSGDGPTVPDGAPITVNYHGVNGRSGDTFDSTWTDGQTSPVTFSLTEVVEGFRKGLEGQKVGSRVLIAMPGEDGYDSNGGNPPEILVGDTLLFVAEITATLLTEPHGDEVDPKKGLPTVSDTESGPNITIPDGDAPTELTIQPLIAGDGAKVAETDAVYLRYRGVLWDDGKVIDENYDADEPEITALGATLIPGFTQGLIGQTVGSRMLLVIPPADGYPDGNETPAVPADATLVYVVDILFARAQQ